MRSSRVEGVEALLAAQARSWPLLEKGLLGLRAARTRELSIAGARVLVRHIPHRIASTTAAVDAASVARRPCFLCRAGMPPEEEGIEVVPDLTAYANPFPILEGHLTVVHREHRSQSIAGFVGAALATARALPGFFVVYNGPACGASAPDHLHFQAASRALFPIEEEVRGRVGPLALPDGRRLFVLRDSGGARLEARVERLLALLVEVTGVSPEPLVNLAFFAEEGERTVLVFPRAKHRPRVFETGELTVSPAAIDLCGVFVVPLPHDFERIGAEEVRSIYDEVSLSTALLEEAARGMEEA